MVLTGEFMDAEEAASRGLCSRVYKSDALRRKLQQGSFKDRIKREHRPRTIHRASWQEAGL